MTGSCIWCGEEVFGDDPVNAYAFSAQLPIHLECFAALQTGYVLDGILDYYNRRGGNLYLGYLRGCCCATSAKKCVCSPERQARIAKALLRLTGGELGVNQ